MEEEEEDLESQELFELSNMVSTIDRVVLTLKRLTETISPGGQLYEAQREFQSVLTGQKKIEEQLNKKMKLYLGNKQRNEEDDDDKETSEEEDDDSEAEEDDD